MASKEEVRKKSAHWVLGSLLLRVKCGRWIFVPRNEFEAMAENSLSTVLSVTFKELRTTCFNSGHMRVKERSIDEFPIKPWEDPNGKFRNLNLQVVKREVAKVSEE